MNEIVKFNDFIRLYESTDDWSMTIDVSKSWSDMSAGRTTPSDFIKEYTNSVVLKKDEIVKLKGAEVWNKVADIVNKLNEKLKNGELENKDIHPLYDRLYDWADQNDILIKAE